MGLADHVPPAVLWSLVGFMFSEWRSTVPMLAACCILNVYTCHSLHAKRCCAPEFSYMAYPVHALLVAVPSAAYTRHAVCYIALHALSSIVLDSDSELLFHYISHPCMQTAELCISVHWNLDGGLKCSLLNTLGIHGDGDLGLPWYSLDGHMWPPRVVMVITQAWLKVFMTDDFGCSWWPSRVVMVITKGGHDDHLDNSLWTSIFFCMTKYHLNLIPSPVIIKTHVRALYSPHHSSNKVLLCV